MKYLAYYFPQFHELKENSEWWGEGFTDWDLVKKAKSNTKEQVQPRIPLNDNYYDLTDINSIRWQCSTAQEYGLSGFNFYHYWFDGKLLLNDPMELFLKDENDLDFCITWANETWTRQWVGKSDVLIKQNHFQDNDLWSAHFYYLLKFFKDKRYVKKEGKPVLCIYRPELNKYMAEYIEFFNSMAIKEGFEGIYFIAMKSYDFANEESVFRPFDALIKFQPRYLFNKVFFSKKGLSTLDRFARSLPEFVQIKLSKLKYKFEGFKLIDYDEFYKALINQALEPIGKKRIYESVIVDWDNTPRYGKKSKFFGNVSPESFQMYLEQLTEVEIDKGSDFIFINAWNEWSEGAYLEPDILQEYRNLEVIKYLSDKYCNLNGLKKDVIK